MQNQRSLLAVFMLSLLVSVLHAETHWRGFDIGPQGWNEAALKEAKEKWGANIVRYQLPIERVAKDNHTTREEAFTEILKQLPPGLDAAGRLGIAVVLCIPQADTMEWDPAGDRWTNLAKYWDDGSHLPIFVSHWKALAQLCADRKQVIWFDLMNEPLDRRVWPSFPKNWPGWAQAAIDGIRAIDTEHSIVIETGPSASLWAVTKTFPILKDPHLIYSLHFYSPIEYTHQGITNVAHTDLDSAAEKIELGWPGTYTIWGKDMNAADGKTLWTRDQMEKTLQPVFDFQKAHPDIPIFVGELGVVRWAPNAAGWLKDFLEICENHGWDWTYHAYREFHGWSLEYDNAHELSHPVLASKRTDRGEVVAGYLSRNGKEKDLVP